MRVPSFFRVIVGGAGSYTVGPGRQILLSAEQLSRHRSKVTPLEAGPGGATWCGAVSACDFREGETFGLPATEGNPAPNRLRIVPPPAA